MGCAHASKILTNDDIEFIAKNTALSKDQVEVFKGDSAEIEIFIKRLFRRVAIRTSSKCIQMVEYRGNLSTQ